MKIGQRVEWIFNNKEPIATGTILRLTPHCDRFWIKFDVGGELPISKQFLRII